MSTSDPYTPLGCTKHRYLSKGEAERGKHGLLKSHRSRRHEGRLIVYFCRECVAFHVGHRES